MAMIQAITHDATSSTTNVAVLTGVVAGDAIILGTFNDSNGPVVSGIADDKSNTWTRATGNAWNFSTKNSEIWFALNVASGTTTITVTYSGSCSSILAIAEESLVATSSALDKTATGKGSDGGGGTALDSGNTATTTQAVEVLYGLGSKASGVTFTPGTNWTELTDHANAAPDSTTLLRRKVGATGAYNATTTASSTTGDWSCLIATFKATAPDNPLFRGRADLDGLSPVGKTPANPTLG